MYDAMNWIAHWNADWTTRIRY